jgi:hypothetical protein
MSGCHRKLAMKSNLKDRVQGIRVLVSTLWIELFLLHMYPY